MKKLLAILLLATATILPQNISGTGSATNPYRLYDAADLDSIRLYLWDYTGVGRQVHFRIENNIDMSGTTFMHGNQKWKPIHVSYLDSVSLNGNHHWIRNLTIQWDTTTHPITGYSTSSAGFFGRWEQHFTTPNTNRADTICNLYFDNVTLKLDSTTKFTGANISFPMGGGTLIGTLAERSDGSQNGEGLYIHNIFIKNLNLRAVTDDGTWSAQFFGVGALVGYITSIGASDGLIEFERIGVDSSSIYMYCYQPYNGSILGGIIGERSGTIMTLKESFIINSSLYHDVRPARYDFAGDMEIGMFIGGTSAASAETFTNLYARNVTLTVNGLLGGDSDNQMAGVFADDEDPTYTYSADNTYIRLNSVAGAELDNCAYFQAVPVTDRDYSTNYIDTTGFATTTPAWYGMYGEEAVAITLPVNQKNRTQIKTTNTFTGWDFINTWDIDPMINDGFPYLQWSRNLLTGRVTTIIDPNGGEVFQWPDTTTIIWTQDAAPTAYDLFYSLDNGSSWITIDTTITDTTYTWIIPNANSDEVLIKATDTLGTSTDQSDATFTILPGPEINILHPIMFPRTITVGDTSWIIIETANVDSLVLFFSRDSLTWDLIEGIPIDTTNGFFYDTTTYIWTMNFTGPGDVYIKAVTSADTAVYFTTSDVILNEIGIQGLVPPTFCTYDGFIQNPFQWQTWEDPSCGWASPPKTARSSIINDYGDGYTLYSEVCDGACNEATEWPYLDAIYWIESPDTLTLPVGSFYTRLSDDTVTYKNRRYWYNPSDTSIYMDDIINGIDSMKLADLTSYANGGYWRELPVVSRMMIYNVQWSKLSGQYVDATIDHETLNDPLFVPVLVISGDGGIWYQPRNITMTLLDEPNNQDYAESTVLAFQDPPVLRYHFRGIHPKAEKR